MTSTMNVPIRSTLRSAKVALGLWNTFPSTALARTLAATPGISWVVVDAEHGQLNDSHIYEHANAIASQGCSPIVRVPIGEEWWIKRALDAGAHGIMVPLVHNASAARAAVSACKYPPVGTRGFGPMFTHHAFGCDSNTYARNANENTVVMVQLESKEALRNVDEIAQVEGLDVLFIGPFDLSFSLGVQFGGPEHEAAIKTIREAAHKHGKKVAFFSTSGVGARKRVEEGFDLISVIPDIDALANALASHVKDALGGQLEGDGNVGSGYSS